MDPLGIESMEVLTVNEGIFPKITRDFLRNLENVTALNLIRNGIYHIEDDAFCELPHLVQLDLTRNALSLTPNTFNCLEDLMALELPSNGIIELQEGVFGQLKKLRVLHLWGNRLKTLPPKIFENLTDLALLELSANQLESLPQGIFDSLINLKQLNLNYNAIKIAPADLFVATVNLQKIRWDANVGLKLHENAFANLKKLETISLVGNEFVDIPGGLFRNSTNIQSISLAKNRLETIPESLFEGLEQLKSLDLSQNRIEHFEGRCFGTLKSLQTLLLQQNRISNLSRQLFDDLFELHQLRLDHNKITTLPNFINQKNLRVLSASHNNISFEDNLLGASPLNQCTNLEELDLSFNKITKFEDDFMIILVQLRLLDLSFNDIESINVNLFQRMDTHERRINLSNNKISFIDFSQAEIMARLQEGLDIMSSNLYNTVISIANNPITCDCNAYDLWRYYNGKFDPRVPTMVTILKEEVRCITTDYLIAEIPPEFFTCALKEILVDFTCPYNCTCNWIPHGKQIIYNCANSGLKTIPQINFPDVMIDFNELEVDLKWNQLKTGPTEDSQGYANVTRLLLSHNEIERVDWVPSRLEVST